MLSITLIMLSANKSPGLSWHPVFIYKALRGAFFGFIDQVEQKLGALFLAQEGSLNAA